MTLGNEIFRDYIPVVAERVAFTQHLFVIFSKFPFYYSTHNSTRALSTLQPQWNPQRHAVRFWVVLWLFLVCICECVGLVLFMVLGSFFLFSKCIWEASWVYSLVNKFQYKKKKIRYLFNKNITQRIGSGVGRTAFNSGAEHWMFLLPTVLSHQCWPWDHGDSVAAYLTVS